MEIMTLVCISSTRADPPHIGEDALGGPASHSQGLENRGMEKYSVSCQESIGYFSCAETSAQASISGRGSGGSPLAGAVVPAN